jgi:hypothetical protein
MTRRNVDPSESDTATPDERSENMPHNGKADGVSAGPAGGAETRSGTERAEEIVDHLAERLSYYTSTWGRSLLRLAARAREEAEDIWAEAQAIRRSKGMRDEG